MSKVEIWTLRSFLLIEQCPGPSSRCDSTYVHEMYTLDVPRDSYACNYRELATLLTPTESLAEVELEPLTIGSMHKNLTTESYPDAEALVSWMDQCTRILPLRAILTPRL